MFNTEKSLSYLLVKNKKMTSEPLGNTDMARDNQLSHLPSTNQPR